MYVMVQENPSKGEQGVVRDLLVLKLGSVSLS